MTGTDGLVPMQLRLAMRVEDGWWVAYLADTGTMDGARELGRIRMTIVSGGAEAIARKNAFMALFRGAIGAEVANVTGATPVWPEAVPAPEHEREPR